MKVLVVIVVVAIVLLALAWWSSGRSRRRPPGPVGEHEIARGEGMLRGQQWHSHEHGNPHGW